MTATSPGAGILATLAILTALALPGLASGQPFCPLELCPNGDIAICQGCAEPLERYCPDGHIELSLIHI